MTDTIALAEEGTQVARVQIEPRDDAAKIKEKLDLTACKALLLILTGRKFIDGLSKHRRSRMAELFRRGVALAAVDRKAAILDNGTQTGVVAMLSECIADRDLKTPLIGVAPAGSVTEAVNAQDLSKVRLDPYHKAIVLTEGNDWNKASEKMFDVAEALAADLPVVAVVAGDVAVHDVLHCVCHEWPVIVVEDSGSTAAQIAELVKQKRGIDKRRPHDKDRWWRRLWWRINSQALSTDDADLREIVLDGNLILLESGSNGDQLRRAISDQVQAIMDQRSRRAPDENTLLYKAWQQFAVYDLNAVRQQTYFYRLRGWPLFLGVLTTILVLSYTALKGLLGNPLPEPLWPLKLAFDLSIIALPIVVSILLAADTRFKAGNKWTLLRSTAEGIKREIYRFRLKMKMIEAMPTETEDECKRQQEARAKYLSELQQKTEDVSRRMMRTDVNEAALRPYHGPLPPKMYGAAAKDDGFGPLDTKLYIDIRIGDQLNYYEKKTNQLERQLRRYQWWILVYGGLGSLLVAARAEFWVPITAAIVGALTTYVEYHGLEVSLRKYNQTTTNLMNIRNKWFSFAPAQQKENIEWLLDTTERTLEYELIGWVQQMQDIVVEEPKKEPDGSPPAPEQPSGQPPTQQPQGDQHQKPGTPAADASSNLPPVEVNNPSVPPSEEQ